MPIIGLAEALALHVHDGQSVAMEGFTHLAHGKPVVLPRRLETL